MGLAHVSCLAWQAEMAVKEIQDQGTGKGMKKWQTCFDCGQRFHGPVMLALGWAAWKTYFAARTFRVRVAATPWPRDLRVAAATKRRARPRIVAEKRSGSRCAARSSNGIEFGAAWRVGGAAAMVSSRPKRRGACETRDTRSALGLTRRRPTSAREHTVC